MIYHNASVDEVLEDLGSNRYHGLTGEEVTARLKRYGQNLVTPPSSHSFFKVFLHQFRSIPLIVLMGAAIIWLLIGFFLELANPYSALAVLCIALVSAAIGMVKEYTSQRVLSGIRNATQPIATVIRNGEQITLPAKELVPGDILVLSKGDYISADARLISSEALRCDESPLTGETVPVEKDAALELPNITPIENRGNMVYAGCSVADGSGIGVVMGTGSFSEQAKMSAGLAGETEPQTPLQKRYGQTAVNIGIAAAAVSAVIFLFGLVFSQGSFIDRLAESFMTCAALAVAAVPQSLAATVTVVLAVGVRRMQKHNMVVRSLSTVETLGKVSVVFTDKTGTLTQNDMTLTAIYNGKQTVEITPQTVLDAPTKNLLLMAGMCCDARVTVENGEEQVTGDHTEGGNVSAILTYGDMDKDTLDSMYPRLCELPFDSARRLKTSVNMIEGKPVAVVKGAPDSMIERCSGCDQKAVMEAAKAMAKQSLRVIAVAFKALAETPSNPTEEELEHNLVFGGLFGLQDPPMEETFSAVEDGEKAGIKVIMMTGDHVSTAVSSAKEMGIMQEHSGVITDDELSSLTDDELLDLVHHFAVYVRLSPENKLRVVTALQQKGYVVAVTGDDVAHVPVLKQADVGCALGNGADVAKGNAQVTVTDDSFASIMNGINAGRGIYENICEAIRFSLSFVMGLALFMLIGVIAFDTMPFNAVQIMWLNLLVSVGSVLPMGLERPGKGLMNQPPRTKDEIFGQKGAKTTFIQGATLTLVTFFAYLIGYLKGDTTLGSTMAFATLGFSQVLTTFSARTPYSLLNVKQHCMNWWLLLSAVVCSFSLWFLSTVPGLLSVFGIQDLPSGNWVWGMILLSLVPFLISEIIKLPSLVKNRKQ